MSSGAAVTAQKNPFPGLRPFREDEEHLFFGRESQVDAMVDKLGATRFLAVVGTSGSGKSSLVNCGLRPALRRGLMARAGTSWRMAQFRPGTDPLRAMGLALAENGVLFRDYHAGGLSLAEIVDTTLRMSKLGLIDIFEQAQLDQGVNLLVVVDQFEELFRYRQLGQDETDSGPGEDATALVNLLLEAGRQTTHPIYVVLTMRSDFLGDCAQFGGLAEAINEGQFLIPRLTRDERRVAINGPIGVGGAQIQPVLLTRLVNDVGDNPDQLSILQHALNRTWARWQHEGGGEGPLDLEVYQQIGTMDHALDQHAEKAFSELETPRQKQVCEKLFKALTDKATDSRGVRRPTKLGTLCALADATEAEVAEVMAVFRMPSRSFLMPPAGDELDADTMIDISHESLMRVWQRLNDWADEEARSAGRFRRLADTAVLHAKGNAGLWRDPDLQLALDWRDRDQPNETWASRYHPGFAATESFLKASSEARDAERREREEQRRRELEAEQEKAETQMRHARRMRWAAVVGLGLAVIAGVLGVKARTAEGLAHDAARKARTAEGLAHDAARKARDQVRVSLATEWIARDPTKAALILLELEQPEKTEGAQAKVHEVLAHRIAGLGFKLLEDRDSPSVAAPVDTDRVWDAIRAEQLAVLDSAGPVDSAWFSFDRNWVIAESNGTFRIWNPTKGDTPLLKLKPYADPIDTALSSPDGKWEVAVTGNKVPVRNASTGEEWTVLKGHADDIRSLSFSPNGTRVVTASRDNTARIWDIETGSVLILGGEASSGHEDLLFDASFSPDGTRVVTASFDHTARIWDARTGKKVAVLEGHTEPVQRASFSSDSKRVVTASRDHTARIWSVATGSQLAVLRGHTGWIEAAFFVDALEALGVGAKVVTISKDRTLRIWDAASDSEKQRVLKGHADTVNAASFSLDGSKVVTASNDGTARIYDTVGSFEGSESGAGFVRPLEGHRGWVQAASFSANGERVVTASRDKTARIWDATTGIEVAVLEGHSRSVQSASFSPNGTRVVTASGDKTARIWNASDGRLLYVLQGHDDGVNSALFSPDGRRVVTASRDKTARIWDATTGKEVAVLKGHSGSVQSASFSPDGTRVVTASGDKTARIWNASDGRSLPPVLEGHEDAIATVRFSPDSERVVTASSDGTVRIWDVRKRNGDAPPLILKAHAAPFDTASFSSDGKLVVTASRDNAAHIWDAVSGVQLKTLQGHTGWINTAAFSPKRDDKRILTASRDGTARIWDAATDSRLSRESKVTPTSLLLGLIRQETTLCLDQGFREGSLGETREEARRQHRACVHCVGASLGDAPDEALVAYRECLDQEMK